MKQLCSTILLTTFFLQAQAAPPHSVPRPRLVVGIVVDQMRWDYLYRYYDRYSEDGFKRLMNEGFNCQNTNINYLPTFTAPGHTCIYTGAVPSIHGIAANDWTDNATGKRWYCTEDPTVQPVGGSLLWGRMSPRNLRATTITDELRLATNMQSRVYGVSLKDRGSILPAGHLANGAYWFDDSTGNFFTSTYYTDHLPGWLNRFNDRRLADTFLLRNWELQYPAATYTQSLPDNNRYEGLMRGETAPVFPHITAGAVGKDYNMLRKIPAGNTMTLKMARACINGTHLGQKGNCDFLTISLSSTDYAGHQYAPNAMEMEDMYLRLDRELAAFLHYLDEQVGDGNYLLFLTADHGGAHNSMYLEDLKVPAGNASFATMYKGIQQYVQQSFKADSLIRSIDNYQVSFNEERIAKLKVNRAALRTAITKWFEQQPGVAYVVDVENIQQAAIPMQLREMIVNGYDRRRSGSIQVVLDPAWYSGYGLTGTTHGTWNPYDAHIPLLWYGWGIHHGETHRNVHMTDISATLAALLHIQVPNGCVGEPIGEIVK